MDLGFPRLEAGGKGQALVDTIAISDPRLLPPVQNVSWDHAADNFMLPATLTDTFKRGSTPLIETGLAILGKDLNKVGVKLEPVTSEATLVIALGRTANTPVNQGEECYFLGISKGGAAIEAETEKGA